ncbi:hypothetical protein [Nodosilinea sp. E11]|uniref:hypothetical protein n=1 Tax=Nodosilinea sp. E11 TaxID=3037479 RepID=UPI002934233F|nr:hypothetical protein [Nodosilinea sp. E11]WOD40441.1 hypothetical protein RRF56_06500 [Nodosilinea sp. E11]
MLWLSIAQTSGALDPLIAPHRPWSRVMALWQFCRLYGDYQATPPSLRRQFLIDREQAGSSGKAGSFIDER